MSEPAAMRWVDLPAHRTWLLNQADHLFSFYERGGIHPRGGFPLLGDDGAPLPGAEADLRELYLTTRTVHCFAVARLMGRPGSDVFIDAGMDFLWRGHRDATHGGYMWTIGRDGPTDDRKQAYGHAFVLLAASSAKVVGHPDAQRLLDDVSTVLRERFWESEHQASAEEFERDWSLIDGGNYRGQNSNMHLTEALMAAFEATGDGTYLEMAESIADRLINRATRDNGGRLPEHFDSTWTFDPDYSNGDLFRPWGTTPGHWLEWSRLCMQLWELGGRRLDWVPDAAKSLFARATVEGWNEQGGFHYTLNWEGRPHLTNRLWWPCAEGIGAAHFLASIDGAAHYEDWYRRIWDFVARALIDRDQGGWRTEPVDPDGPARLFDGKPDLYHALQASVIPLLPADGSITRGLLRGGV